MPKANGHITEQKILEVAEKLFSEIGYDGTSIDAIAKNVGINKATIYYHFKDKRDIIVSLFKRSIDELEEKVSLVNNPSRGVRDHILMELDYLRSKKRILSVMMMEALKSDSENNFLFEVTDIIIKNEISHDAQENCKTDRQFEIQYKTEEFLMGILPFFNYIIFEDRWAEQLGIPKDELREHFISAFMTNHIAGHK